jgi:hypothetical protein
MILFIAPLNKLSISPNEPHGFVMARNTLGKVYGNLGCDLVYVLDLILCRSLN